MFKTPFSKSFLLKSSAAVTLALSSVAAMAVPLTPVFSFDPGVGERGTLNEFQANNISADYDETITFGAGTFDVSIALKVNSFSYKDTGFTVNYSAAQTGLGINYELYGLFKSTGTWAPDGSGGFIFNLDPNAGSFKLWMDKDFNTANPALPFNFFDQPASGASFYTTSIAGIATDDVLLATGIGVNGNGFSGGAPNLSGAFGQTTTFNLTDPAGGAVFTQPRPFYNLSFTSGQFEGFPVVVGQTTRLTGTLNTVFAVPEPATVALLGLGLVGLGFSRRRTAA